MVAKTVKVINKQGMHMRPAGLLARTAAAHNDCSVTLRVNDKSVNAKVLMQIMSAGIKCGSEVEIICEGKDEQAVLDEIMGLFENSFGEQF